MPGIERYDVLADVERHDPRVHDPSPALELGLRWLAQRRPPAGPDVVLHGDFRNGNLIVGEDGIRAVLDWELAHLGDPMQDLGYLCVRAWRFGGPDRSEASAATRTCSQATRAPAARPLTLRRFVGGRCSAPCGGAAPACSRHGATCLVRERSVELAAIGRRVWEQEYDVMLALA